MTSVATERWAISSGVSKMATVTAQRHPKSKRPVPSDHVASSATALMQDLFLPDGSLGQACDSKSGQPLLGTAKVQEIRELVRQAQRAALLALEPLLQAERLLHNTPKGIYDEVDQVKLRNARAALRDAMVYFMVPQTLGVDSKSDFVNVIRSISTEIDQDVFSSQMQNAYMKLLRNLQDWLSKTDVATGKSKKTEEHAPIPHQPEPEPLGSRIHKATSDAALKAWQWRSLGLTHVDISDLDVEAAFCVDGVPSRVKLLETV
jgi:hypothetical protein